LRRRRRAFREAILAYMKYLRAASGKEWEERMGPAMAGREGAERAGGREGLKAS